MKLKVKEEVGQMLMDRGYKPFGYDLKKRVYEFQPQEDEISAMLECIGFNNCYQVND